MVSAATISAVEAVSEAAAAWENQSPVERGLAVCARDGVRLFHREWGSGQAVLFVHSWALNHTIWNYQIQALAAHGLHCIAFDRRGHGRSDPAATGYDMDTLADDLAAVIDTLGLRNLVLVGHSMGGGEIIRYLARHGSAKISKVVLIAPTTPFVMKTDDNPYGAPKEYFETRRAEWMDDFPKWIEDNKLPFFTPDTSPAMMEWIVAEMRNSHLPTIMACNYAFVETDLRPDLAKVDRPTLILQGDKDASAPLEFTGRRTAAGIAGAVLKVYREGPHAIFLTHRKQVNQDILDFISA